MIVSANGFSSVSSSASLRTVTAGSFQFQIVSDIHAEALYSRGKTIRDVITPSAPFLIVAGDLGRVENEELYRTVIRELCSAFQKVFLIPGNHEYYSMNEGTITTIQMVNKFLYSLRNEIPNFYPLVDDSMFVNLVDGPGMEAAGSVMLHGSTFWSYAPHQHYMRSRLFTERSEGSPVLVDCAEFNRMHFSAIERLERSIQQAARENRRLLVITHYAPSFRGTLAPKHTPDPLAPAMGSPKNYMYCSSSEHLVENSCIVAWVYGHTGHNGNVGKLVTNQMDRATGIRNAILDFNV